jgi:hypothetical protein
MRARRGLLVGWAVVGAYAALLGVVVVASLGRADLDRSTSPAEAAAAFVEAWERSRTGTFVASGTVERRSEVTGAALTSEDVVAQRPPARLHRQQGGVDGRVDDRLLLCAASPTEGDDGAPCQLGPPGGPTYAESVDEEVVGLRSLLEGPTPVYEVRVEPEGCFALEQLRPEPRAPFGVSARFCFDDATGAPTRRRVAFEGGITETLVVTQVRSDVTDADLEP